MNIQEFETRTGLSVEQKEYAKIEQIYLNAESMDKDAFCKAWKLAKGATLELIEDLSHNVDGKRIHINRLDTQIENLKHDLELEREIKSQRAHELEAVILDNKKLASEICDLRNTKTKLAAALIEGGMEYQAIEILGRSAVIGLKCAMGYDLTESDKQYIAETFGK